MPYPLELAWLCVRSYGTSAEFKNVPIYDGVLERFDKEKNSGDLRAVDFTGTGFFVVYSCKMMSC